MPDHPTIAALKATAPSPESPLPWKAQPNRREVIDAVAAPVCDTMNGADAAHIAAAVNAAPQLLARVAELERRSAATVVDVGRADDMDRVLANFNEAVKADPASVLGMVDIVRGAFENARDNFNACAKLEADVRDLKAALEAARVAVEGIGDLMVSGSRTGCDCWECCRQRSLEAARRAVGLEEGK